MPIIVAAFCYQITHDWLAANHHPNQTMLTITWSLGFSALTALWQHQIHPSLSKKRLTRSQKTLKLCLFTGAGLVLGFTYGASLTPPHADPGQAVGGILFGLIGGVLGVWLGSTWREPAEVAAPDIGFESN